MRVVHADYYFMFFGGFFSPVLLQTLQHRAILYGNLAMLSETQSPLKESNP